MTKSSPMLTTHTGVLLHAKAIARNLETCPYQKCLKCDGNAFVRWGIDRQGKAERQRWRCENGHVLVAPRQYPFGKQFQSDPRKLLKAERLMASGKKSFQKIAESVGLDRYTIYKLRDHIGKPLFGVCERPLGHTGHCKPRFKKSKLSRVAFDEARESRRISKPGPRGWKVAERALDRLSKKLKELEQP